MIVGCQDGLDIPDDERIVRDHFLVRYQKGLVVVREEVMEVQCDQTTVMFFHVVDQSCLLFGQHRHVTGIEEVFMEDRNLDSLRHDIRAQFFRTLMRHRILDFMDRRVVMGHASGTGDGEHTFPTIADIRQEHIAFIGDEDTVHIGCAAQRHVFCGSVLRRSQRTGYLELKTFDQTVLLIHGMKICFVRTVVVITTPDTFEVIDIPRLPCHVGGKLVIVDQIGVHRSRLKSRRLNYDGIYLRSRFDRVDVLDLWDWHFVSLCSCSEQ